MCGWLLHTNLKNSYAHRSEKASFPSYRPLSLSRISDKADQCSVLCRTHPYICVWPLSVTRYIYLVISTQLPISNINKEHDYCLFRHHGNSQGFLAWTVNSSTVTMNSWGGSNIGTTVCRNVACFYFLKIVPK
jgi:hypothetical protein